MKIRKPQKCKTEGVILQKQAEGILNTSFVSLILGKPGSGKTHLLQQLVSDKTFYGNKFDHIFYIGPTKYKNLQQDQQNWSPRYNQGWMQKIIRTINEVQQKDLNVLFVFDDVIAQIFQNKNSTFLNALFFNRRHLIKEGCISVFITAQKYTMVPTFLRSCTNSVFVFKPSNQQLETISRELSVGNNPKHLKNLLNLLGKHEFLYMNIDQNQIYNNQFIRIA